MANLIASALLRSARSYAGQLTSLIKSLAPKHLQNGVRTSVQEVSEGKVRISIKVRGADAHAQEYGSGLHGKAKAKYPILPKNKKLLAFYENARGTWIYPPQGTMPHSFTDDGRGLFPKVMHPGIEKYQGRGYVRPAVKEFRARIRQKGSGLRQEVRQAILGEIRKSFSGAKK